jgi:iron complex transport system ATP-binding protein
MTILKAVSLTAGYSKRAVIRNIDLEAKQGEVISLIGPNGAGKSTLLKCLSADLSPLSGRVLFKEQSVHEMPPAERAKCFSVLLTDRIRSDRMSCGEMVSMGRYPYTGRLGLLSAEDKKIVKEAMEKLSVLHLFDTDIKNISDGQRQSVMLARAIAQQPRVLLLDEPTAFLDMGNKLKVLTAVRRLAKEGGITVIQSIHEIDLAQKFSDRIICLKKGCCRKSGSPEEIFTDDFISSLYDISTGSCNALLGTVEAEKISGEPEVFCLCTGLSALKVYRRLQRQGTAFAVYIKDRESLDYSVADQLAACCTDDIEIAKKLLLTCKKIILSPGAAQYNELADLAEKNNIPTEYIS